MSNSYRIRTKPGVDTSIKVLIDQEFEYLEILSLKLLKNQIYTRPCSDYGVIVGRISVNNGFGIPNAKVSVFVPLDSVDENNPIITDIYPYKTLTDLNDEGYRYNLLPYEQKHSGHVPTGTFFTREDVLTNPTLIEVYDKYFKYTAITNDSGDYMIFGVPVGSQTVVVDIDLSDIGEFSLSPQDLVRMGIATDKQVSGTKFKSSTNLNELPQIVNINRSIEVEPLWGEPEVCNLGITRTDFDLSGEINLDITPTAIFMGSLISSGDDTFLKSKCKTKSKAGNLCELVTGPGEILAIRQTIKQDILGRPALEQFDLEQGGQVIDENGTWLIDLPMNLDYVVTNEFGEQVLSDDPNVGIPTKAKYRFKIKWNQSPSLSADPVKRGYFLVPNIKEYGWEFNNGNRVDPYNSVNYESRSAANASYAFSLDWDEYGAKDPLNNITPMGAQMISEGINCEDRFYEFQYNKVYTVSQLITQYRKGYGNSKIISVKDILDSECASENNKFPTNDGMVQFDIIYLLFTIMMFVFRPILYTLIIIFHILALLMYVLYPIIYVLIVVVFVIIITICWSINAIWKVISLGFGKSINCPDFGDMSDTLDKLDYILSLFTNIQIPVLSYPDCEFCACEDGQSSNMPTPEEAGVGGAYQSAEESGGFGILSPFMVTNSYTISDTQYQTELNAYEEAFSGDKIESPNQVPSTRVPSIYGLTNTLPTATSTTEVFTNSLTIYERLNLFNTKAKYFEGINRIEVGFNHTDQPTEWHSDNVICLVLKPGNESNFEAGNLITFQDPLLSTDPNITGFTLGNVFGTNSITGSTVNNSGSTFSVAYADPNNPGSVLTKTYNSQQDPNDAVYAKFPMDIEYFQVITGMTINDYSLLTGTTLTNSLPVRFLFNDMYFYRLTKFNTGTLYPITGTQGPFLNPSQYFDNFLTQRIVFLVRGVDPNSTRSDCQYDLSRLFGFNTSQSNLIIKGGVNSAPKYKLNIPIQGGYKNVQHNITNNTTIDSSYSNMSLYYDSYHFQPESVQINAGFTGFTSNLPSYYSRLDGTNMGFAPQGSLTLSSKLFLNSSQGVKVQSTGNNNRFVSEVVDPVVTLDNNNATSENRGYFVNEIIEGGSAFYSTLPPSVLSTAWSPITPILPTTSYQVLYFAPKYASTTLLNYQLGSSGRQIVMRSDRLPTSTVTEDNLNNSFALHANSKFTAFYITDNGGTTPANGTGLNQAPLLSGTTADISDTNDEPALVSSVINSFNCGSMVPLGCYYSTTNPNEIRIQPQSNSCYRAPALAGGAKIFAHGGCYVFVSTPILSIITDFKLLTEWMSRLTITFGACRNVFGHIFTNNWINGTLYAFSFKNDVSYSSPLSNQPNQASYKYCRDVLTLHPTYNFYYRSSPYNYTTSEFVGKDRPSPSIGLFGPYGGNVYNLQYPTTVMDLGPRNYYIQELVMSDDYDGYVANKLVSTTYSDVSELLNLFILTRLANEDFLASLISGNNILTFFSRQNQMIDADYAQAISINSELGVAPFESANYPDNPSGQDPIYINTLNNYSDQIFGVFFSSDTKTRDFITPKRTIINPTLPITNSCTFSNFRVFTQEVPFYQWNVKQNNVDSIFGTQENEWYSSPITGNGFFSHKYQLMDRIDASSRYFRTNNTNQSEYFKGYIYGVNTSGQISANVADWNLNSPKSRVISVGGPFHFYFGLKKGKSAFDRFSAKWIDTNKIVL